MRHFRQGEQRRGEDVVDSWFRNRSATCVDWKRLAANRDEWHRLGEHYVSDRQLRKHAER